MSIAMGCLGLWGMSASLLTLIACMLTSVRQDPHAIDDLRALVKWGTLWPVLIPYAVVRGAVILVKGN